MSNLFSGIKDRVRGAKVAGPSTRPGGDATPPRGAGPDAPHNGSAGAGPARSQLSTPQYVASPAVSPARGPASAHSAIPEALSLIKAIEKGPLAVDLPRPLPMWLNPLHAKHIVKGNFMTLSTRPKTVERGEWVAHQVVEHFRNLWNFVRVVHEKEDDGTSICNPVTCPKMSAGKSHSYTWLNRNHEPVELPAHEYMTLMHRWMSGKTDDTAIFPTDPASCSFEPNPDLSRLGVPGSASTASTASSSSSDSIPAAPGEWLGQRSGFPHNFSATCQLIFRQIFRVYAHLYWDHFVEPFYHLSLERALNSCFSHFILTATSLDMLKPAELEPMQCLIDMWAADGTFPPESRAYSYANVARGRHILSMGLGLAT